MVIAKFEVLMKPIKGNAQTEPVSIENTERLQIFYEPEEDSVYSGIRNANGVLTCRNSNSAPLA